MKRLISLTITIVVIMISLMSISYAAVVKEGEIGAHVVEVQRMLIAKGLLTGEADGICGLRTVNAIKKFQAAQGLVVDGICGDETYNLLVATVDTTINIDNTNVNGDPNYVIQFGMQGEDVAELQNILIALGYMSGTADGICGEATVNAIAYFQSTHGLIVDGICGQTTFDAINKEAADFTAGNKSAAAQNNKSDSNNEHNNDNNNTYRTNHNNRNNSTSPPIVSGIIEFGMQGANVTALQKRLIALGFLGGEADGIVGDATVAAIKKFQISCGLPADGIAGALTIAKLNEANLNSAQNNNQINNSNQSSQTVESGGYAEIGSVIKFGMHGEGVVLVQRKLIEHGFLSGEADGIAGNSTISAIKKFQSSVGLEPTGICDLQTYAALENADYNISDTSWSNTSERIPSFKRTVYVEATAYSRFDAGVGTHTARGNPVRRGIIAVDPLFIPLGTRVYIPGYGEAIADDTGGAIKGNRIDIAFDTYEEAIRFGRQSIEIYILDD